MCVLKAAYLNLEECLRYSLNAYFMRSEDLAVPLIRHVEHSREDGSLIALPLVARKQSKEILR